MRDNLKALADLAVSIEQAMRAPDGTWLGGVALGARLGELREMVDQAAAHARYIRDGLRQQDETEELLRDATTAPEYFKAKQALEAIKGRFGLA